MSNYSKRGKAVMQLDSNGELVKVWECMTQAVDEGGFIQSCISNVCLGKRKSHGGFGWKLLKDFEEECEANEV